MNYRPTVLNISAAIFLMVLLISTIVDYDNLSSGEGWGIVAMLALMGIGLIAGIADFILQQFVKNRRVLNTIGLFVVLALAIWIIRG